mmetsp:Transcript_21930/g.32682  ORF Transcript_21930/g.32682 Transcript_21930/m.32682 type:complete len:136 (+) Transcript_21930:29-436(+)
MQPAESIRSLVESWVGKEWKDTEDIVLYDGRAERLGLGAKPAKKKDREEIKQERRLAGRLLKKRKRGDEEKEDSEKEQDEDEEISKFSISKGKEESTKKKPKDFGNYMSQLLTMETRAKKKKKRRKNKKKNQKTS